MKITFDPSIKLAGVGIVPWGRLGPEQWLPNYAIASLHGWDLSKDTAPMVVSLDEHADPLPVLVKQNTNRLLHEPLFQRMLDQKLPGYDLLVYKPAEIPEALAGRKMLTAAPSYTETIENKAVFRRTFNDIVRFPNFEIVERSQLPTTADGYHKLLAGRQRIVLQDEQLSGGKGSFIVGSFVDYQAALQALEQLSSHELVVVSDAIENAEELSVQCCVTAHGIFTGPLQRQIIGHPELSSPAVGGDKFCGVQVAHVDRGSALETEMQSAARIIGKRLQEQGYRGIFGVDFLLGDGGLYVLEVNARLTGATPLLTALYDDDAGIPFYLLHLLELGQYSYELSGKPTDFSREGSLLMVHSLHPEAVRIKSMPASGSYRLLDGRLQRISDSVKLGRLNEDEFVIQEYMPPQMRIKPGGRLAVIQFGKPALTAERLLDERLLEAVKALRQEIITEVMA